MDAMAESRYTRCPGCATVFRVTPAQLELREGQVRCGHCRAVFDANDHFVSLDAGPAPDDFDATDELMMGRPTVTLRSADALHPVAPKRDDRHPPGERPIAERAVVEEPAAAEPATVEEPAAEARAAAEVPAAEPAAAEFATAEEPTAEARSVAKTAVAQSATAEEPAAETEVAGETAVAESATAEEPAAEAEVAREAAVEEPAAEKTVIGEPAAESLGAHESAEATAPGATAAAPLAPIDIAHADRLARFEWKKRRAGEPRRAVYVLALIALVVGIALQAVLEYRDALAALVPATRPLLASACRALMCTIEPPRDAGALSIDASDLQADPAHRGLLMLSATIRNRAAHAIAYPHLELTLTDSSDRIVVRRAFAPAEYAGGTADTHQGIAANGERLVKLFLDASSTQQAGYRLYLFYP